MSTTLDRHDMVAAALRRAEQHRAPIAPPSGDWQELDADDAYRIQLLNVRHRVQAGAVVRGYKIGLTSRAMQEMLGVSEPDYGHLLDDMLVASGSAVALARFCAPRVEPEVAFRLARPLMGPGCRPEDVVAATETVHPALEIIDSRVVDWRITLVDTIADNASSAAVVLGEGCPLDGLDLRAIDVTLSTNGEAVAAGATSAVLGDPAAAVAWLVDKLSSFGVHPGAGDVVLPGSCTRAIGVAEGDAVRADFAYIGSVGVSFVSGAP